MNKIAIAGCATVLLGYATGALAQQAAATSAASGPDLSITLGLKLHWNRISTNAPGLVLTTSGVAPVSDELRTGAETSIIPIVSARYRDFFASASYLGKTDYSATQPATGLPYNFEREEYDLNFGYYILPGLAVTVGYKNVDTTAKFGSLERSTEKTADRHWV